MPSSVRLETLNKRCPIVLDTTGLRELESGKNITFITSTLINMVVRDGINDKDYSEIFGHGSEELD